MHFFSILLCILQAALAFLPHNAIRQRSAVKFATQQSSSTVDGTAHALDECLLEINGAKAMCRTFGGNVFSYITKDGIEVMGTRKDAVDIRSDSKPYAGGNPHCFPQFGPGAILQHGFARGMKFVPGKREKDSSFDRMTFKLLPTEETKKIWDHNFEYRFDVTLREDSLEWDVIVANKGSTPFDITLGMHTYFDVSSLKNVVITGPFAGATTVDKVSGATGTGSSNDVVISQHVDMLYKNANTGPATIKDTGKGTITTIESKGFSDWVLWNPYGNEAMGFDKFVCVEPVSASPVTIPPGEGNEVRFYQKVTCRKI
jgi:glucose-6-phosphate 1-epimerase